MSPLKSILKYFDYWGCLGSDRKKEVKRLSNNSGAEENIEFQEWLNKTCLSVEDKEKVKEIIIDENNPLEEIDGGKLDLREYPNLETLIIDGEELKSKLISLNVSKCLNLKRVYCYGNQLTKLDLTNLPKLEELICSDNRLTSLDLTNLNRLKLLLCRDNQLTKINYPLNPKKLTELSIRNNNLVEHDLSIFSRFINLEKLFIGNDYKENIEKGEYNRFFGSLKPLQNLTKLKLLHINNTYVDTDLENLPENIREIYCQTCLDDNQLAKLQVTLDPYKFQGKDENDKCYDFQAWKWNQDSRFTSQLRREWEENDFSYQETKQWIKTGLKPDEVSLVNYLKWKGYNPCHNLNLQELRKEFINWIKIKKGVQDWLDQKYPKEKRNKVREIYLNEPGLEGELDLSDFTYDGYGDIKVYISTCVDEAKLIIKTQLEKVKIMKLVQAQKYICKQYPTTEARENTTKLGISSENLEGELDLSDFVNLRSLNCSYNKLTSLNINNCSQLESIWCTGNQLINLEISSCPNLTLIDCSENQLVGLDFSQNNSLSEIHCHGNLLEEITLPSIKDKLIILILNGNNFFAQDLSFLTNYVNLELLHLGNCGWYPEQVKEKINQGIYNRWYGSLMFLKNIAKLKELEIIDTDIDSGLEHLPANLEKIYCKVNNRPEAGCRFLQEKFSQDQCSSSYDYRAWRAVNVNLMNKVKEAKIANLRLKTKWTQRFSLKWRDDGNLFSKFAEEATQKWIELGFTKDACEEWLKVGMKVDDSDYCAWLRDVKKIDAKEMMDYDNNEQLEKEFKEHLKTLETKEKELENLKSELQLLGGKMVNWSKKRKIKESIDNLTNEINITKGLKLSGKVIEKIKDFKHNGLTLKQKLLVDKLITNQELRKRYQEYGLCHDCQQPNAGYKWCQPCKSQHFRENFNKWTSGNKEIDRLIQEYQLKAVNRSQVLEWIPYNKFKNIEYLAEGGFGKVYIAEWPDRSVPAVLKSLHNSQSMTAEFLQEITFHKYLFNASETGEPFEIFIDIRDCLNYDWDQINSHKQLSYAEGIVDIYGISQDPKTKNYVMVMRYISGGDMRQYSKIANKQLSFYANQLWGLTTLAKGLSYLHESGMIHRDLHPGNVLNLYYDEHTFSYITDLGLCQPVNSQGSEEVFGVLPYVAPEILKGEKYTPAADIYSFGIIACEWIIGLPPYYDVAHDNDLALKICLGLRPDLNSAVAPQLLKDLITKCLDANPLHRPTAKKLYENLEKWVDETRKGIFHGWWLEGFYRQYEELKKAWKSNNTSVISRSHPSATYTSRLLDFKNLPEPQNSKAINEQFWNSRELPEMQGSQSIGDISIPLTEPMEKLNIQDNSQQETSLQAQIQIPPK